MWVDLATVPANQTTYTDVIGNTTNIYDYQIVAVNAVGYSGVPGYFTVEAKSISNIFTVDSIPPADPSALTATLEVGPQVLLAWSLKRKFKPAEGTRLFLDLFIEMGAAAAVFGLLTWSFFGTSPGYAIGGPKILGFLPLFSPTTDVLVIIGLSLAIGVVVQLASILAGMLNALRVGDVAAALFDFGAWFLMLVGILGWVAAKMLPGIPPWVGTAALAVTGASALVIVAFAGRGSKGIGGRILTGVISLYGIVGAYGIVAFFSDALSYSRLAILNLTSGFIALVGNLMGDLIVSTQSVLTAIVSLVLGTVIIVVFHVLNLVLGMMGSFIHSLRLNYLESFSRYYRTGGTPFLPLRREGTYHRFEQ